MTERISCFETLWDVSLLRLMITIRQNLNINSSFKLNDLLKLYRPFKDSSFSLLLYYYYYFFYSHQKKIFSKLYLQKWTINNKHKHKCFLKWSWHCHSNCSFEYIVNIFMPKFLFTNNCWSKQNNEKCPMWPIFIYTELSETANGFVKIRLALEKKDVACFIGTCFYWKWDCIWKSMNRRKRFMLTRSTN